MKILIVMAALLCVAAARAQDRVVSIDAFDLGYTGGILFKSDKGKGNRKDRDENNFRLNLNYAQKLPDVPQMMIKGVARMERSNVDHNSDTTNSVYAFSAGVLLNQDAADVKNSLFAGAQAGFEWQSIDDGTDDETGLNLVFSAEGGKRWDMGSYSAANISYAPSIELLFRRYGGDIRDEFYTSGTEVKLNFLKFDILF